MYNRETTPNESRCLVCLTEQEAQTRKPKDPNPGCYLDKISEKGEIIEVTYAPSSSALLVPSHPEYQTTLSEHPSIIKCDNPNEDDKPSKLETDPSLPIVDAEPCSPELEKLLKKYNISEGTLTMAQKSILIQLLEKHPEVFSKSAYDLGCCS